MAKGNIMLQLEVSQFFAAEVTEVPLLDALVFDTLDGDRTTVREIAAEKVGFLSGNGSVSGALSTSTDAVFTRLFLVLPEPSRPLKILYAPSHVSSPPFEGVGMAILKVSDFGYTVESPGKIISGRVVGAHAYLEEVE